MVETKRVKTDGNTAVFYGTAGDRRLKVTVDLPEGSELYLLKTMDNPVNKIRRTILVRCKGENPRYHLTIAEA